MQNIFIFTFSNLKRLIGKARNPWNCWLKRFNLGGEGSSHGLHFHHHLRFLHQGWDEHRQHLHHLASSPWIHIIHIICIELRREIKRLLKVWKRTSDLIWSNPHSEKKKFVIIIYWSIDWSIYSIELFTDRIFFSHCCSPEVW